MYFLSSDERQLLVKSLLPNARQQIVAEELRGWSWNLPPMEPPYSLKMAVYEVANKYCETSRDVWWRKVQNVRVPPNQLMIEGNLLHAVVVKAISRTKKLIWSLGLERAGEVITALRDFDQVWFEREVAKFPTARHIDDLIAKAKMIWEYEAAIIEARLRESMSRQPYAAEDSIVAAALPVTLELRIDGSLLGLSKHLSTDAYQSAEPLILELKFGEKKDFHKLQVTGYALVAESLYEYPLNIGCLVYPRFGGDRLSVEKEFFLIDEELRQRFLEQRDDRMRMVFEKIDPGMMTECPRHCPYFDRCHEISGVQLSLPNGDSKA